MVLLDKYDPKVSVTPTKKELKPKLLPISFNTI